MKNVIMLVLDSLGADFLEQYRLHCPDNFFDRLERISYCAKNMYANGPYTESAIQGMLLSQRTCDNKEMVCNKCSGNETIFSIFKRNGYEILSARKSGFQLDDESIEHSQKERDIQLRGFMEKYFADRGGEKQYRESDIRIWKKELDNYFEHSGKQRKEAGRYRENKESYIRELWMKGFEHTLCRELEPFDPTDIAARKRNVLDSIVQEGRDNAEEVYLGHLIRRKNAEIYQHLVKTYQWNDTLEENRDLRINNEAYIYLLKNEERGSFYKEQAKLLEYLDKGHEKPFFFYWHNEDFHYPERLMDTHPGEEGWSEEIAATKRAVETLNPREIKMSVGKYIAIEKLSWKLERLFGELRKRDLKDTVIILTADHGAANCMYPLGKKAYWDFCSSRFHIPFYMIGGQIVPEQDKTLRMNYDIIPTLAQVCGLSCHVDECKGTSLLSSGGRTEIMVEWINGITDIGKQSVKYGIRNENYSLTLEGCVHQLFESHRIISLYNLQKDPDELVNLAETADDNEYNVSEISDLLALLRQRYLEISIDYFEGKYLGYECGDSEIAEVLKSNRFYTELQGALWGNTWREFDETVAGKKLYVFGASVRNKGFFEEYSQKYAVEGILDNSDSKEGKIMFSRPILKPHAIAEEQKEDVVVLITSTFDISILMQLKNMNIKYIFIYNQLENSRILKLL